jgi:uncharacterized protein (TIGR02246 family)
MPRRMQISNAIGYAQFRSRSHKAVIRVYDSTGNVIEAHEHAGEFKGGAFTFAPENGAKSKNGVTSDAGPAILFKSRRVQFLETYNAMNWRKFVLLGCVVACVFAASSARAQMRGHGNSMSRMGMRGAFTPRSIARMPMHRAPILGSMGRMPMHRAPMMNSALGLRRFNRFNDGDFDRDDRFHRFNNFNKIIFISDFSLAWWWGWGWGPWWGWNWGYPYGSYDYSGYGYGYGNYGYGYGSSGYDYGYGYPSGTYYGSYYSATNYENDDESVVRNVLAEYTVSWNRHDTAAVGRLFTENCDYVNLTGVHWKGVQEIVQRHGELFQNRLKTAVRTLTGAEVRFSTPDVALVHATWDVTGWSRPTGEAVPVLKEITTMMMVKTDGKWLITAFQDTESGGSTK